MDVAEQHIFTRPKNKARVNVKNKGSEKTEIETEKEGERHYSVYRFGSHSRLIMCKKKKKKTLMLSNEQQVNVIVPILMSCFYFTLIPRDY